MKACCFVRLPFSLINLHDFQYKYMYMKKSDRPIHLYENMFHLYISTSNGENILC